MSDLDAEIAAARAELAALNSEQESVPIVTPEATSYSARQFGFDIPAAAATAGAGLLDVLSLPITAAARGLGASPEEARYFALSKELAKAKTDLAQKLDVRPETLPQEAMSFLAPSPLSKAKVASQVGSGLASYLGFKAAQFAAPESPGLQLAGALLAPASVSAITTKAVPALAETGKSLQRSALGLTKSNYTKVNKNQIVETIPGTYVSQVQKSADNIIANKQLGTSTDPNVLYNNLQEAKSATEDAIQNVLQNVDATRQTGIIPRLDNTLNWINTKAPADKVQFYKDKVNTFLNALKEQGQGSLVYLNQQKKAIGENWKSSPETDPTFWRKFYGDVKTTIEKNAPEVKDLNKSKQDLIVVEPVLEKQVRAAGQGWTPQDLRRALLYTTGGGGLVGASVLTGNPLLGALISGGLGLLGTKKGQQLTGRTLSGLGNITPEIPIGENAITRALQQYATATPTESPISTTDTTNIDIDAEIENARKELQQLRGSEPTTEKATKQNISMLADDAAATHGISPSLVKAVIKAESNFNPSAKSKVGAQGLMQLMPDTAKMLGVADAFDPAENVQGGAKYLKQLIDKFGDEKLALAAYNWGEGNIQKQLKKLGQKGKPQTLSGILKYGTLPDETEQYLKRVSKFKSEIA
jgi:hypothetical protein